MPAEPAARKAPRETTGADRRRAIGRRGEDLAAAHLQRLGFRILARNVRTRAGEIDLIARGGGVIAFVEVKTARLALPAGAGQPAPAAPEPLERLGRRQRARLRRLAVAWLSDRSTGRASAGTVRFDAIGVLLDRRGRLLALEHLEGAW